jgi:serine/threonine protein phosphatase PrpC
MSERSRPPFSATLAGALIDGLSFQKWDTALHRAVEELGFAMASHPGHKRRRNEDRLAVAHVQTAAGDRYTVAIVCDGVGGSENGDRAATLAIAGVLLELTAQRTRLALGPLVAKLVRAADDFVRSELKGRGTTTMALLLATPDSQCVATSIGDSRVYAWKPAGELVQVSVDDTVENELKALPGDHRGVMQAHGLRGRLSQAIGEPGRTSDDLRVIAIPSTMFPAGVILGTDGLWRAAESFAVVVGNSENPAEAARRGVQLANWCGGVDNASMIAVSDLDKFCTYRTSFSGPPSLTLTVWVSESRLVLVSEVTPDSVATRPQKAKRRTSKGAKEPALREPELPLSAGGPKDTGDERTVKREEGAKPIDPRPAVQVTIEKASGHESS